ncbi:hypothetical protein KK092_17070 [Curtobacterium flaccumfaciens pv. flaccumfaciens]|uniref:hypothetical protein n=1 Tax=Curtobacterium flaccumfaciens TaxID=2035 RepID=UPI001BDE4A05|nr:hypothetical protein [Curtobacterium flaccumfaciens]MBT1671090.1 hypothetical protein [Curtobacterium flaccumfaciens pv. flaccumfaciens]
MATPRAICFDLDGTLFDHRGSARVGVTRFLQGLGVEVTEAAIGAWFTAEDEQFERWRSGVIGFQDQRRARLRTVLPQLGVAVPGDDTGLDAVFDDYLRAYRGDGVPRGARSRAAGLRADHGRPVRRHAGPVALHARLRVRDGPGAREAGPRHPHGLHAGGQVGADHGPGGVDDRAVRVGAEGRGRDGVRVRRAAHDRGHGVGVEASARGDDQAQGAADQERLDLFGAALAGRGELHRRGVDPGGALHLPLQVDDRDPLPLGAVEVGADRQVPARGVGRQPAGALPALVGVRDRVVLRDPSRTVRADGEDVELRLRLVHERDLPVAELHGARVGAELDPAQDGGPPARDGVVDVHALRRRVSRDEPAVVGGPGHGGCSRGGDGDRGGDEGDEPREDEGGEETQGSRGHGTPVEKTGR